MRYTEPIVKPAWLSGAEFGESEGWVGMLPAPRVFLVAKWIREELDRENPLPGPRISQAPNTSAHAPASAVSLRALCGLLPASSSTQDAET